MRSLVVFALLLTACSNERSHPGMDTRICTAQFAMMVTKEGICVAASNGCAIDDIAAAGGRRAVPNECDPEKRGQPACTREAVDLIALGDSKRAVDAKQAESAYAKALEADPKCIAADLRLKSIRR